MILIRQVFPNLASRATALLNAMNFGIFYDNSDQSTNASAGQMYGGYNANQGPANFHCGAKYGISLQSNDWQEFLPLVWQGGGHVYQNGQFTFNTFAVGEHGTDYGLLLPGAVVVVTPIIIIFLLLQRYFTQGIAMTGLKG